MEKLVKVTTNNQVAIPAGICRRLHLHKGSYLEAEDRGYQIILRPVRVVHEENYKDYERFIKEGRRQAKRGETVSWEVVKKQISRLARKKS